MFGDLSGKLHITAIWPAEHSEITISYTSPQYSRLLRQISPEMAIKRLGQIVTLCPYSQRWVAACALDLPFDVSLSALSQEWLSADVWFLFQMAQHTPLEAECLSIIPAIKQNAASGWTLALGQSLESWLDVIQTGGLITWLMASKGFFARLLKFYYQTSWQTLWPSEIVEQPFLALPDNNQILHRMVFRLWRLVNLALGLWQFHAPRCLDGRWMGDVPRGKVSHYITLDHQTGLIDTFDVFTPTDARWQGDCFDFLSTNLHKKASQAEWMSWIQALDPGVPLEWNH